MNYLWIDVFPMQIKPSTHPIFGVYCSNGGNPFIVLTFYVVDGLANIALIFLFVHQIQKIAAKGSHLNNIATASIYCIFISIISTWLFVVASVFTYFPVPQLRWFFPLHFTNNVVCLLRVYGTVKC
eukprot:UN06277